MQTIPSAIDGEVFEYTDSLGTVRRFRLNLERDDDHGAPWEEHEGHGPVSDWEDRDKRPGEWVLNTAERGNAKRFYDAQAAQKIALRDSWGIRDGDKGMTKRQIAAEAVRRDFEYLRAWCRDDWFYLGVIVTPMPDDDDGGDDEPKTDYTYALWGVESDCTDYIKDTALELARECSEDIIKREADEQREADERAACEARDIRTV